MTRIILDADPGIDDAIAIMLALHTKEIQIEAITTVNGNCSLQNATQNTFRVLDLCKRKDIKVYEGTDRPIVRKNNDATEVHGEDGLGGIDYQEVAITPEKENAISYMTKMVGQNPGQITMVATGPLSNLALAVQKDPQFANNVKELIVMGGAEKGGNITPYAEFNFWNDPEAAKVVFEAGFQNIVMLGLDVTRKIVLTPNLREFLRQIDSPYAKFIHDITRQYNNFHWEKFRILGSVINDPLNIMYLIKPTMFHLVDAYVTLTTEGEKVGQTVIDRKGKEHEGKCNAKIGIDIDPKGFFEILLNTLFPNEKEDIKLVLNHEFANKN